MNKKQYLKGLFKVKTLNNLKDILLFEEEGTITRGEVADINRALKFIEYGFEEGIKFEQGKEKQNG